jgi:hypothetical protein
MVFGNYMAFVTIEASVKWPFQSIHGLIVYSANQLNKTVNVGLGAKGGEDTGRN